jgi:signal transduction histidine kinase
MTEGTSTHGDGLSVHWTGGPRDCVDSAWRRRAPGYGVGRGPARGAAGAAPLQLLALSAGAGIVLGLLINTSWQVAAESGSDGASARHLVVMIVACILAAALALRSGGGVGAAPPQRQAREEGRSVPEGSGRLLAQMHHELRTPLNAMIGFSEVMLRELHGPLGNARYQEYAAHISESGGRLLKASEDALAIAATMSALMADRRALRRERLPAGALLREAWAASGPPDTDMPLRMGDDGIAEIECDRQATCQALQHLLGEAAARTPAGGAIAVRGGWGCIEITIETVAPERDRPRMLADASGRRAGHAAAGDGLRIVLARSLIEMQGATLTLSGGGQGEGWMARIAFPAWGLARQPRRSRPRLSAAARWPGFPARRGDCVAAAALRASARTHAAPLV